MVSIILEKHFHTLYLKYCIEASLIQVRIISLQLDGITDLTTDAANTTDAPTEGPSTTLPPPRYHSGWMTWLEDTRTLTGSLALAWLGFADVHSGISHYLIPVGSSYGGSELTPVSLCISSICNYLEN